MGSTTITPLPGYVLVEPIEGDNKTSKGVYLPETIKDKPMKAKVIKKGGDVLHNSGNVITMDEIDEGDTIIHKKWVNETVDHEGKEYLFVRFEDILGVIDE